MKVKFLLLLLLWWQTSLKGQTWNLLGEDVLQGHMVHVIDTWNDALYVGGGFQEVNNNPSAGIVIWNGSNISIISNTTGALVKDFVQTENELFVVGTFPYVDGVPETSGIASWQNGEWSSVGGGGGTIVDNPTTCFMYNDKLYVAGDFDQIGPLENLYGFASWDGTQWTEEESTLGTFYAGPSCLEIYQGMLIGGGDFFLSTSGTELHNVASFDGTSWHDLNGGVNNDVYGMFVDGDNLYVGGTFSMAQNGEVSAPNNIAYYDGSNWHSVGQYEEIGNTILAIAKYRDQIYAGGLMTINGVEWQGLAYFDGVHWQQVPGSQDINAQVKTLQVYNDELYIGGYFSQAGGLEVPGIVRYYLHPDSVHWGVPDNMDELSQKRFLVYPNPAEQKLHVNTGEIVCDQLVISDLSGKIIFSEKIKDNQELVLDISEMNTGTLLLSLIHGGVVVATERVLKE